MSTVRNARAAFATHRERCPQCSNHDWSRKNGYCLKGRTLWRQFMNHKLAAGRKGR